MGMESGGDWKRVSDGKISLTLKRLSQEGRRIFWLPCSRERERERDKQASAPSRKVARTEGGKKLVFAVSAQKAKRALEKEVPFDKIPPHQRQAYDEARSKEWNSWKTYDAAEPLSASASEKIRREKRDRVIRSRYVYRDKNAGMTNEKGEPLPLKAKVRLCVQGQFDPDCASGEVQVDAPTIQKVTFMTFLHLCASFGWTNSLRAGDVSSAFLQGAESKGEPLYMEQPKEGIPGLSRPSFFGFGSLGTGGQTLRGHGTTSLPES